MEEVGCIVVGAGVIGLAVARALAVTGRDVVVLEREGLVGSHTSSRNSEVIHAGLYYPAGSRKAELCVRGREQLYAYCAARGVPHRRLGKIIVATEPDQERELQAIDAAARANGVEDLQPLDRAAIKRLEPELRATGGLLSPSTGIIDSHALMFALQGEAEAHGAVVALRTAFLRAVPDGAGLQVTIEAEGEVFQLRTQLLVNAAGLFSADVAGAIEGIEARHARAMHLCKGNYFGLSGKAPFSRLIYPVPERHGLGVHLTLDLTGRARFGPDTEWVEKIDYSVDPARANGFYAAIRRYWPALPDGSLVPDYAGLRPKLWPAGGPATDFGIEGPDVHGVDGLVNIFGLESPGLTSCLAVAEHVVAVAATTC